MVASAKFEAHARSQPSRLGAGARNSANGIYALEGHISGPSPLMKELIDAWLGQTIASGQW
jgi:hypothetical protein